MIAQISALAIYIHWPFCVSKCPYCDFASFATPVGDETRLLESYKSEIAHYAALTPERRVTSLYFGGGTPSLMKPETLAALINEVSRFWPFAEDIEITLEANPVTAEIDKFEAFRAAGVNRLSLGVQSFSDETLRFLGRAHDADQARRALHLASAIFPRFSFDLIYAMAGQTLNMWREEVTQALAFRPKHLSLYQLTVEPHTAFHIRAMRGAKLTAFEDKAADLYEATQEILGAAGLPAYEISNHAALGEESRHNLTYWTYGDYLGIGPAAHGRLVLGGERQAIENHKNPKFWADQIKARGHGAAHKEILNVEEAAREALLMGLRLSEGVGEALFVERVGVPVNRFIDEDRWAKLEKEGLVFHKDARWGATREGRTKLNAILDYCIA